MKIKSVMRGRVAIGLPFVNSGILPSIWPFRTKCILSYVALCSIPFVISFPLHFSGGGLHGITISDRDYSNLNSSPDPAIFSW